MSIVVTQLTKKIGKQFILNNISFKASGIIALLGPNGAGKSSLIKILTTFSKKTVGSVALKGFDIERHPHEIRKIIGYLPENNPLYLDLYVKEYLKYVAKIRKIPLTSVAETIEKTGLEKQQHKKIKTLSKGYRQRVGLAQAMIHNPSILILDEPTTGLDPNQILEIRSLIKDFGKNKTVLLSTHIMQEVDAICNQVLILKQGVLVKNDTLSEIKKEYKTIENSFYKLTYE